eukprot:TRINITY_DN26865_c0_g1_i1.p1 TRINITY_DN26865_c0_g1~~TRINITY_DN26865_c0_g1_i1.p1  ORF type:complete len:233 (+),score=14.75 TRINITY_DN26865_c0_g1_i1:23-700(+)
MTSADRCVVHELALNIRYRYLLTVDNVTGTLPATCNHSTLAEASWRDANFQKKAWHWLQRIKDLPGPSCPAEGATQIVPGLFLGGAADALDTTTLQSIGVTHILNCASSGFELLAEGERVKPDYTGLERLCIDGRDDSSFDWVPHLATAVSFVERARQGDGLVLVHCLMGLNRSGMIVVAYLMLSLKMCFLDAFGLVRQLRSRYVVANEAFQLQLLQIASAHELL